MVHGFLADGFLADGFLADGFLADGFLADGFLVDDVSLLIAHSFLTIRSLFPTVPLLIDRSSCALLSHLIVRTLAQWTCLIYRMVALGAPARFAASCIVFVLCRCVVSLHHFLVSNRPLDRRPRLAIPRND